MMPPRSSDIRASDGTDRFRHACRHFFDVHLDYGVLTWQVASAARLAWIVVQSTDFIEQRAATSTL
jgi:hypothetical protein